MRRRGVAMGLAMAILATGPVAAQDKAPSAEQVALARKFAASQRLDEQIAAQEPAFVEGYVAQIARAQPMDADTQRILTSILRDLAVERRRVAVETFIELDARNLTADELNAAIAFAETPYGKSMVDKSIAIQAELARRDAAWSSGLVEKLAERLSKRMADCMKAHATTPRACADKVAGATPPPAPGAN